MPVDDGGQAFAGNGEPGMTRRDYYKGQVAAELISIGTLFHRFRACEVGDPEETAEAIATWSGVMADALIAEEGA
jgi:hypothetical protein